MLFYCLITVVFTAANEYLGKDGRKVLCLMKLSCVHVKNLTVKRTRRNALKSFKVIIPIFLPVDFSMVGIQTSHH